MTTLASLCELIIDCEHKTAPTVENGYPLIRTPDIGIGRLHIEGASRVDEAIYEQWTKRAAPREGDLILAREAPVGNIGIIKSGVRPVLGQRTVLIRPKTDILDSGYLNYLLSSPPLRGWMIGVANGATVPHLNMSDIRSMEIPVMPSIDTQRKIASVLMDYDDLIENNNRRIKLLEEMAQRIYREWFVDFRYPGHEAVPLVESELGLIPNGWRVKRLEEVTFASRGMSWGREQEVESGGHPIITIPNVQDRLRIEGTTRLREVREVDVGKYLLAAGDTVLVGSNGNL
jgi:type I restriction enzyme S subunit